MDISAVVAATGFVVLAVGHSVVGEKLLLTPLLAGDWTLPGTPRPVADQILRWGWHLASVAWLGFAAIALGANAMVVVAVAALVSAFVVAVTVRGHFAWPIFATAGFAGLLHEGALPDAALQAGAFIAAAAMLTAGALHVYWAAGGRRFYVSVLPNAPDGSPLFAPTPAMTLSVGVALFAAAGLFVARALELGPRLVHWAVVAALVVFAIRAIGDGRQVGFSKTDHSTDFARNDTAWFTPLVTLLAFGAAAAALI